MTTNNNNADYYKRHNEYIIEIPGRMYIFEVTKFCGYSTFVYMYKDETMTDLYNRISHHFCCTDIKGLYIDSYLYKNISDIQKNETKSKNSNYKTDCCCSDKTEKYIPVQISSLLTIKEFVFDNTAKEPRNLEPIYPLPIPVVYRIYLDDGHCHNCQ